ncbi:GNAT family N-acetyltransferase [Acetivibrio saccincola]|jgi:ribosomal protein S18 acetylase RimI-like enzyme|uniref:GNAT family N-acetyltransferase n=1 Tax=Acetivibrio saccincola TaxID=1677857 RepID=A0A2S8RCH9_9FIRM|nr:GNAT family N-acetyltransferase [Acetivibrio saccincola]PQQ67503.1 GNAT family N-acetyltransferase [Acetivibrio saccincola]
MIIENALISDLEEILALQKLAYLSEAEICNDFSIPPLLQTIEDIKSEYAYKTFLKAVDSGKIIGSVRANLQDGTCYIGKLIVHPDYQNRGIGTALMNSIENCFKGCKRYELFTGKKSVKNIYLYNKLGYRIFKEEKISEKLTLVSLEKIVAN